MPIPLPVWDKLPFGVALWVLETPGDSRSFRSLNGTEGIREPLGMDIEPFSGMPRAEADPDLRSTGRRELFLQALTTQRVVQVEPVEVGDARSERDRYFTWAVPLASNLLMVVGLDLAPWRQELAASEGRFNAIMEQFPYAVVTYAPDGTMLNANRAWEEMWNDKRENTIGYNIRKDPQLLASGLSVLVEQAFNGELAVAEPYLYDPALIGKVGRKRWIQMVLFPLKNDKDAVLQVVLILQDVTDRKEADEERGESAARKKAEEALKQSEERLRAILDNTYNAFVAMDDRGVITEWNTTAETMFGWTRQEAVGKNLSEMIIPVQYREAHNRGLKHYLSTGEGPVLDRRVELSAIRRDGSEFPIELSIRALKFNGEHTFNAFIADITDRKKAEAEIRQGEERFKRLLETAPDAMVIVDINGVIQLVNAQAEAVFGYERAEMVGHPVEFLIPANLLGNPEHQSATLARDPKSRMMGHGIELEGRRKGGSEFPIEVALSPLETEGGLLVSAAVRDISERRLIEDAQRHLVAILRSSNDAIISQDVNGIVTSWNPGAQKIFGYTPEEIIGKPVGLLFPADKREEQKAIDQRVLSGNGHVEHYETIRLRKDGTSVDVSLTVSPIRNTKAEIIGASKFAHDITDRRRAQAEIFQLNRTLEERVVERTEELLKSEKRYHDAMDVLIEGVQIIGFDWRYLYVNDSLVEQSLSTREELIGQTLMEHYPGIEQSGMFGVLQHCMKERTSQDMETEFTFPNGVKRNFHLSIQPVPEGLFVLSTDITERKRAELEVTAQREQLERQNKELEQFAYIASHDLQEPLRMVTSYVQLLQRRYGDKLDSDANEFIAFAVDGTFRMKQLITDVLTFSRSGDAVNIGDVDMNNVLKQVLADLALAIADRGAIVLHDDLPTIRASDTEMHQLLQNLIGNAVKFRRTGVIPEIRVSGQAEGEHWRFDVQDNGIGIEEQYSEKVFVPFKRLHDRSNYSGSGIGLAVAQKIVHRYGGRIWFTSVPGQGTTFHFTIKRRTL